MKGKRLSIDGLSLFYAANGTGNFRVGISVGKKLVKAAATRNRIKRRIRASIMKTLRDQAAGYDLVFVARRGLEAAGYEQILKAVETVLHRSSVRIPAKRGKSTAP